MKKPDRSKPALNLSSAEVTDICAHAKVAWDKIGPRATKAPFTWRGMKFVASHSQFRLLVDTVDGRPVACRYD
ncbi:MAG: hypothetical protein J0H88_01185 [Sphingomonadales bacterium]|nr:hypothetical protein [Sphingomonadales bacterium]